MVQLLRHVPLVDRTQVLQFLAAVKFKLFSDLEVDRCLSFPPRLEAQVLSEGSSEGPRAVVRVGDVPLEGFLVRLPPHLDVHQVLA